MDINDREAEEAEKDGAKLIKNSGRGMRKGDAHLDNYLIDYKFYAKQYSVSEKNWDKVREDAINEGFMDPVISVVLGSGTKLAVIDWNHFMRIKEGEG
jgi:hypothetical protein